MPSNWVEENGISKFSLQEVIGQTTFERILASLPSSAAPAADSASPAATSTTEKIYEERLSSVWLNEVCSDPKWKIQYNCGVKTIQNLVKSYFVAKEYRPDLWFSSVGVNEGFPLNYVEILSNGDLDTTVGESERTLIDQLRLYRMFDTSCTEVHGYVVVRKFDISLELVDKERKKKEKQNREEGVHF